MIATCYQISVYTEENHRPSLTGKWLQNTSIDVGIRGPELGNCNGARTGTSKSQNLDWSAGPDRSVQKSAVLAGWNHTTDRIVWVPKAQEEALVRANQQLQGLVWACPHSHPWPGCLRYPATQAEALLHDSFPCVAIARVAHVSCTLKNASPDRETIKSAHATPRQCRSSSAGCVEARCERQKDWKFVAGFQ
jgi:hypothetical protein